VKEENPELEEQVTPEIPDVLVLLRKSCLFLSQLFERNLFLDSALCSNLTLSKERSSGLGFSKMRPSKGECGEPREPQVNTHSLHGLPLPR